MQKRQSTPTEARVPSDAPATTDASVAVKRLAAQRPLGSGSFRARLERAFLWGTKRGAWAYFFLVLLLLVVIQCEADRWWLGTVIALGPKWPGLLPLAVLAPLSALLRPRLLMLLLASTLLYLFGIMSLCIPWPWDAAGNGRTPTRTVMTCNVARGAVEWGSIRQLIENEGIDVIALQDMGGAIDAILPEQWQVVHDGELAIAARLPIGDQRTWQGESSQETQQRVVAFWALIEFSDGPMGVCNVHLSSPQVDSNDLLAPDSTIGLSWPDQLQRLNYLRDRESEALAEWIRTLPQVDLIVGDFSMPVESQIYRRWWQSYANAFSTVGAGFGWTQRASWNRIGFGLRTDHVLVARDCAPVRCVVGPDIGSDHVPVVAQIRPLR